MEYNNYHEKSLAPTLKKGEKVYYRMLPMRVTREGKSVLRYPNSQNVRSMDFILDPNSKKWIEIRAIDSTSIGEGANGEAVTKYKDMNITFWGKLNGGMITISAGNNKDAKLYQYLESCNWNGSNPNRDVSKQVLFERLDLEGDAKKVYERSVLVHKAQGLALTAEESELRNIADKLSIAHKGTEVEALRLRLLDEAKTNPGRFLELGAPDPSSKLKDQIREAIDGDHIKYDEDAKEWQFDVYIAAKGQKKLILPVPVGSDAIDAIVAHMSSKDGQDDLDRMIGLLGQTE